MDGNLIIFLDGKSNQLLKLNNRKATKEFDKYCTPLLHLAGFIVSVVHSDNEGQIKGLMDVMENTDYVVIAGGDGSLSEVLTLHLCAWTILMTNLHSQGCDWIFETARCFYCFQKHPHWHCAVGCYQSGGLLNFRQV
jgi:Diacylglycerol kinase catalytic domain